MEAREPSNLAALPMGFDNSGKVQQVDWLEEVARVTLSPRKLAWEQSA